MRKRPPAGERHLNMRRQVWQSSAIRRYRGEAPGPRRPRACLGGCYPSSRSAFLPSRTSRQKTHQAKADRAPRFRQCLIIAPRSSTCRVELHWRLGPGANHGRMARIAEAWDRSTAPGATSRSTISSASIRLQRLRLACRSGAQLIPILATRYGWARPGHACLWTDILNPL